MSSQIVYGSALNESLADSIESVIAEFGLSSREWNVLERRYGFERRETLAEIATKLDCSRERVRQIENLSLRKINSRLAKKPASFAAIEVLEQRLVKAKLQFDAIDCDAAVSLLQTIVSHVGDSSESLWIALCELLVSIRAVIACGEGKEILEKWTNLSLLASSIIPEVRSHPTVSKRDAERSERERRWTYEELASHVLSKAGKPLHWRQIADEAERLDRRESVVAGVLHNTLVSKGDTFVRVGPGEYGLTLWGLQTPDYYTDIIARVLQEHGSPLTANDVFAKVSRIRAANEGSIRMSLDTHHSFYKSLENTYGHRSWLKPRHQQNLGVHEMFCESARSYERLERAKKNGYRIDE